VQATAGQLKSHYIYTDINLSTDLHTADEFNNLVVKNEGGRLIRIRDIGNAEMGSQDYDSAVYFNGSPAVFIGITSAPEANPLTVVDNVLKVFPQIQKSFPPGLQGQVVYNTTLYIKASIKEVIETIIEATLIVIVVIFLFLGALRSVLIPVVTIPLSLIGVCFLMLAMNFSLNLLTLLAMVLAIGLVVDDAIVVLENIYRHLEEGLTPFQAAIKGAREITGPVIVMTTTLAAVFAPIGFMGGLTGSLFTEFAFTLAASVIISGIIALTFSPMLCSKIIDRQLMEAKLVKRIDALFTRLKDYYKAKLTAVLNYRPLVLIVATTVLISIYFLYTNTKTELAPTEDQSFLAVFANAPSAANLNYLQTFNPQLEKMLKSFPETLDTFQIDGFPSVNGLFGGLIMKTWDERKRSQMDLYPLLQNDVSKVAGLEAFAVQWPSLPGVDAGLPVQFVITTTGDHKALAELMPTLEQKAMESGLFMFITVDLKYDKPELNINVNREKAASLGIQMSDVANALTTITSGGLVNYFSSQGYSFQVIPQVPDNLRTFQDQLNTVQIATASGDLIPLSSIISFNITPEPSLLYQFNQLNAATLQGMMMPGISEGQAIAFLQNLADQTLPKNMSYNYTGESRQFVQEGNALIFAFIFAIIVIFLVLSAQFESFRDPFIILVAVPMSICGALIPLFLGFASINIYTQIGLITLIGLISKHGILMVEFANKLQEQGMAIREAIIESASIRLRPILMTTAAMVFGVVPLIVASGAGAVSRSNIGLVIACGMTIGTCFTLFVVPTIYTFIAKDRVKDLAEKAKIQIMPPEHESH
jgi:multidrug efflux pump